MNTELKKKAKNDFEKDFFKLVISSAFCKTMESKSITNGNEKTQIFMNKSVYLDLSILELSNLIYLLLYEFRHDYVKPKYNKKVNLSNMDKTKL